MERDQAGKAVASTYCLDVGGYWSDRQIALAVEENVRTDINLETSSEQRLLFIPQPFAFYLLPCVHKTKPRSLPQGLLLRSIADVSSVHLSLSVNFRLHKTGCFVRLLQMHHPFCLSRQRTGIQPVCQQRIGRKQAPTINGKEEEASSVNG